MRVQTNIEAANSSRMLKITGRDMERSTEKLSSGYRINRGADDAAGLSISERSRKLIRGLNRAADNTEDGISMMQIADGALQEIQSMLNRGTELSIQAANGTLSRSDREDIQRELDQMNEEIDRIAEETLFNEVRVLHGNTMEYDIHHPREELSVRGTLPLCVSVDSNSRSAGTMASTYVDANNASHAATILDFSSFRPGDVALMNGTGFHSTCCTCERNYSIMFSSGSASGKSVSGRHFVYTVGIQGVTSASQLIDKIISVADGGRFKIENGRDHWTGLAKDGNKLIMYEIRQNTWPDTSRGYGVFAEGVVRTIEEWDEHVVQRAPRSLSLQLGAETDLPNKMALEMPAISAKIMGLSGVNVVGEGKADEAITAYQKANEYISGERSRCGAYQNRLEHTLNNLNNVVENTQSAESRLRDTDMAEEMVHHSKNNILQQAGQSMLAQANHQKDQILSILQ